MKRILITIMGLVAGGALLAACAVPGTSTSQTSSGQNSQTAAQSITAETGSISDRVIGTGAITANQTVDLAFQASGAIKDVLVKVGDEVKAGQTLATLDDSDLKLTAQSQWASYLSAQAAYSQTVKGPTAADLKKAKADLASAQAAYSDLFKDPSETDIAQLRADLQNAEASLKQAQAAYDAANRRNPAGIGGTQQSLDLEQATNNYNKAKALYDAKFAKPSNSSVASASAQIQSAKASLDALQPISETIEQKKAAVDQAYIAWQQADNKVKQATLTAPMSGLVTAVNFVAGATATSGASVVQIADFAEPIFVVNVDEADLGKVKAGEDARVRLQTYPNNPISATVTSISPVGTSSSNGITTYEVKLKIPKAAGTPTILLNMSGTGEIVTTQIDNAVLVPNNVLSVNSTTKKYSVQLMGANGQTETIPVEIGARSGDKTQILSGVKAGDVLVIPSQTTTQQFRPGGPGD